MQNGLADKLLPSADVLARAFSDDPVLLAMAGAPERLRDLFELSLLYSHNPAHVDVAVCDDQVAGVAVWNAPSFVPTESASAQAQAEFRRLFGAQADVIAEISAELEQYIPPDAWYLSAIGAGVRGMGVGSALLHARLDGLAEPAYLESSKESNIPIYAHYGFTLLDRLDLSCSVPVWRMLRP